VKQTVKMIVSNIFSSTVRSKIRLPFKCSFVQVTKFQTLLLYPFTFHAEARFATVADNVHSSVIANGTM